VSVGPGCCVRSGLHVWHRTHTRDAEPAFHRVAASASSLHAAAAAAADTSAGWSPLHAHGARQGQRQPHARARRHGNHRGVAMRCTSRETAFSLADTYIIQPSHWPTDLSANQTRKRWVSRLHNVQRPTVEPTPPRARARRRSNRSSTV
jgi:hypothetical protein